MPAIAPAISAALSKSKGSKGHAKNKAVVAMVKAKKKVSPKPTLKQPTVDQKAVIDKGIIGTMPKSLPMVAGYMQQAGMAPAKGGMNY